jgi:hypothetical protein
MRPDGVCGEAGFVPTLSIPMIRTARTLLPDSLGKFGAWWRFGERVALSLGGKVLEYLT